RVKSVREVSRIIALIEDRAAKKQSGFARVYPRLVGEYFGGLHKHFHAMGRVLRIGGQGAYIIGDQSSFFATPIPTAKTAAEIIETCGAGLRVIGMEPLKSYRGTRG